MVGPLVTFAVCYIMTLAFRKYLLAFIIAPFVGFATALMCVVALKTMWEIPGVTVGQRTYLLLAFRYGTDRPSMPDDVGLILSMVLDGVLYTVFGFAAIYVGFVVIKKGNRIKRQKLAADSDTL
jgi:hypothetical protein